MISPIDDLIKRPQVLNVWGGTDRHLISLISRRLRDLKFKGGIREVGGRSDGVAVVVVLCWPAGCLFVEFGLGVLCGYGEGCLRLQSPGWNLKCDS